jgi:hypothetical protein
MTSTLLQTTKLKEYSPQTVEGETIVSFYERLAALIKSELGEGLSLFLAKPAFAPKSGIFLWSSPLPGAPKSYHSLRNAEKVKINAILSDYAKKLADFSAGLIASDSSEKRIAGVMLAGVISDLSQVLAGSGKTQEIYLMDEKPVLAGYGFFPSTLKSANAFVAWFSESSKPIPIEPSEPIPIEPSEPFPISPALNQPSHEGDHFPPASLGVWKSPEPWTFSDDDDIAPKKERKKRRSLLPFILSLLLILLLVIFFLLSFYKSNTYAPEVKAEPILNPPLELPNSKLVIPADANDLSFLEGCWDYINSKASSVIKTEYIYCFDKAGHVDHYTDEYDNEGNFTRGCDGKAEASLSDGTLEIIDKEITCPYSHNYQLETMVCKMTSDDKATCSVTRQKSGGISEAVFVYRDSKR